MRCRKGGTKRYYSKEEKLCLVEEAGPGRSSRQVAESNGIADSIVRKWVRQYREGGEEALTAKRKPGNPLAGYWKKKAPNEVEQLRHELALVHMQIARLKKQRTGMEGWTGKKIKRIYFGVIDKLRHRLPVPWLCKLYGVSKSGYYLWKKVPSTPNRYALLHKRIDRIVQGILDSSK